MESERHFAASKIRRRLLEVMKIMENNETDNRKVLFIATVYSHLASFHIPFMEMLQGMGYEVHAAACSSSGRREEVEKIGVTCWEIPFARSPYSPANLQAFLRLRDLLKEHHFDLIHVHTPVAAFLGRYLAKKTNQGSVLYTAHGFHFYEGAPLRHWLLYYSAEKLAVKWTDGLIVMNQEDFEAAQKRLGFREGHNLFFVHGVGVPVIDYSYVNRDVQRTPSVRSELGINSEDVVVACIGELNPNKNQSLLLDAWKRVTDKRSNVHLLIIGDGAYRQKLERQNFEQNIRNVHLLGYRNDVPYILQETDILAHVSKREGLPKVILEAMAASKPIVATGVRGNRDLIEHGRNGFLVPLGDVGELESALLRLIDNEELRKSFGLKSSEKIRDYSLDNVLLEMKEIYSRFLPVSESRETWT